MPILRAIDHRKSLCRHAFRRVLPLLLLACAFLPHARAGQVTFYYTFGEKDGGVGTVKIDDKTGEWQTLPPLASSGIEMPKKLAISQKGDRAIVTSDPADGVEIYTLGKEPKLLAQLHVTKETEDVAVQGNHALLTDNGGNFLWIDLDQGKIDGTWDSRTQLHPPGNRAEGIVFLSGSGNLALSAFQKDSKKGNRFGSRLVILDTGKMEAAFDLQLPRNHPECNIEKSFKEQGPGPEVIFIDPKSDTLAVTLDLYGAIAFARYSAVLKGTWDNLEYVSCALDGSWGNAFPDRGCMFDAGGKAYLLISNASANGGLVLFEMGTHKVKQKFPASAGCETPVFLSKAGKVVTCVSGKLKSRTEEREEKIFKPENDLLVFDVAPLAEGKKATLERISFDKPVFRVNAVAPAENDLLFLVLGEPDQPSELVLYDLAKRKILHREPAEGPVSRVAVWRKSA